MCSFSDHEVRTLMSEVRVLKTRVEVALNDIHALQKELNQVKARIVKLENTETTVISQGANSTACGARGVAIGGDAHGTIITGGK